MASFLGPGTPSSPEPQVQTYGAFRIPNLFLSSADFGLTLTIKVSYRLKYDGPDSNDVRVYYLSPLDVGDGNVMLQFDSAKLSKQIVVDLSTDTENTVTVEYTPIGSENTRRDYSLGGWMFALPLPATNLPPGFGSTNLVRVPTFDKNVLPAATALTSLTATVTGPVVGVYTVALKFVNPFPTFGRTQYAHLWMFNYFNDGDYRSLGTYRLHGAPGDTNGQTVTFQLESDGGGHNVSFYAAHANGQRAMPFAKVINTYTGATVVGGFP